MATERDLDNTFIATHQYEAFVHLCTRTLLHPSLVVMHGKAGVGKSVAAQRYATFNEAVMYCTLAPHERSSRDVYRVLMTSLFAAPLQSTSTVKTMAAVKQHLPQRGITLAIIDEADFLNEDGLEALRVLSDQCNISIVIVTLPKLVGRIQRMPQFQSRVAQIHRYDGLSRRQLKYTILPEWSSRSAITFTPHQDDADEIVDALDKVVGGEDGIPFRKATHILQAADEVIRRSAADSPTDSLRTALSQNSVPFNAELIYEIAWRLLGIQRREAHARIFEHKTSKEAIIRNKKRVRGEM